MFNMRNLILVSLSLVFLGSATAQNFSLIRLYSDDLAHTPARISLSPNYLTVIEFWAPIVQVSSGQPSLLNVDVNGSKVYLSPTVGTGRTDLIVDIAGKSQLFLVVIEEGETPRRYAVSQDKPELRNVSPDPATAVNAPPLPEATAKSTIDLGLSATEYKENNNVAIHFALRNNTPNPIAAETMRIKVYQGDQALLRRVVRGSTGVNSSILQPGEEMAGIIFVDGTLTADLKVQWPVVELGPGKEHNLSIDLTPQKRSSEISDPGSGKAVDSEAKPESTESQPSLETTEPSTSNAGEE